MRRSHIIVINMVKFLSVIHFGFLFIFCMPDGVFPDKVRQQANGYAYPLFSGRWNLFAPSPPMAHKEIRYRRWTGNQYGPWIDPLHEVGEKHHSNRIGSSTKMFHIIQNSGKYLWDDYYRFGMDSVIHSFGYCSTKHLINQLDKNKYGNMLSYPEDSIEIALITQSIAIDEARGNEAADTLYFPKFESY